MSKITPIKNLNSYYNTPLKVLISHESNKDIRFIRKNYGQLGVDIFQNEKKPSILSKKDSKKINKLINNIKKFFGYVGKNDYEESDSLNDVMFKYIWNKKSGKTSDIKEVFGQNGMEMFKIFKHQGYIE